MLAVAHVQTEGHRRDAHRQRDVGIRGSGPFPDLAFRADGLADRFLGARMEPFQGFPVDLTAAGAFADALEGKFRPIAPDAFQRLFELAAHLGEVLPVVRAVFIEHFRILCDGIHRSPAGYGAYVECRVNAFLLRHVLLLVLLILFYVLLLVVELLKRYILHYYLE